MDSVASNARPWTRNTSPQKVLIIRFHAFGDIAATLPYCSEFRKRLPQSEIHYLSIGAHADLPRAISSFDRVITFPQVHSRWFRLISALRYGFIALRERYDLIIDLQGNWVSVLIRSMAAPSAWATFDRSSRTPAADRVRATFDRAGFPLTTGQNRIQIRDGARKEGKKILVQAGWDAAIKLVLLNPAGLFITRQWPVENWISLALLWRKREKLQFVGVGTPRVASRNAALKEHIGSAFLDLTGLTTVEQALAVIHHCDVAVSEDSGLLHMAVASGVPTLALFGSTPSYWARPVGAHATSLTSSDLECGDCGSAQCKWGDTRCLTRYSPERILAHALALTPQQEPRRPQS